MVRGRDDSAFEFLDTTRVTFRVLDEATIERYVARESPLDCAGGFKSEGLGISLCESIDSVDPTALIGLPLIRLCAVLRRVGFRHSLMPRRGRPISAAGGLARGRCAAQACAAAVVIASSTAASSAGSGALT